MDMKVQNLIEQFEGFKLLAGAGGLGRRVSTVTVMDAPDIYDWMKGGEFLITTAYIMKDNPLELKDLIIRLNKNGASALGIKIGRFIEKLPDVVKDTADRLNFPIIHIPINYAFSDVIHPALSRIVNAQAKKLMMSERIHKSFTQLVIEGRGTDHIVETLYGILNRNVAFKDLVFNKIYVVSKSNKFKRDIQNLSLNSILDKYFSYPVQIGSSIYGYIIVDENKDTNTLEDLDEITIEHASTVLKLNIQKEISNRQIEQKYRDEFIQDLLLNNIRTIEEVNNRAALYGWKMDKGLVCLIVDIDDYKVRFLSLEKSKGLEEERDTVFRQITAKMKKSFYNCYYTTYSDSIVYLIEPDVSPMKDFFNKLKMVSEEIRKEIRKTSQFTATIGIGSYKESVINIYTSFIEAQKAVRIGRTIYGGNNTHVYDDLGVYRMLFDISQGEEANCFCSQYLEKLIDYDIKNNCNYMGTLKHLVRNDWNLKKTAEDLFIHYNTMKYRFSKIIEIINLDLNNRENKFMIELCLKLMDISKQYSLYMKTNI